MRLILTLLVRDEADIIRQNINYHLSMGVDFFIVTDNRSTDGTLEILKQFESLGVLRLIQEKQDNYAQAKWVSKMAHIAKTQHHADWVINSDADEFWWPLSANNLPGIFESISHQWDVVEAQRLNFVPLIDQTNSAWHERMVYRENTSTNPMGEPLPPKVCHRGIAGIKIDQGNHRVICPDCLKMYPQSPIEILHFPMRSYVQFENKIKKGGAAYERNSELPENLGHIWRKLYKDWKKGKLPHYYQTQTRSPDQIEHDLHEGQLIRDTRLKNCLRDISSAPST